MSLYEFSLRVRASRVPRASVASVCADGFRARDPNVRSHVQLETRPFARQCSSRRPARRDAHERARPIGNAREKYNGCIRGDVADGCRRGDASRWSRMARGEWNGNGFDAGADVDDDDASRRGSRTKRDDDDGVRARVRLVVERGCAW